jgi:hypothetical protein
MERTFGDRLTVESDNQSVDARKLRRLCDRFVYELMVKVELSGIRLREARKQQSNQGTKQA